MFRRRYNIFVSAPRTVHDYDRVRVETRRNSRHVSDGVSRFQSRDNSFCFRQQLETGERFFVGGVIVLHPTKIAQIAVLWTNRGIIESGRNRMGQLDFAVAICKNECLRALEHAEPTALKTCRMFPRANAFAT